MSTASFAEGLEPALCCSTGWIDTASMPTSKAILAISCPLPRGTVTRTRRICSSCGLDYRRLQSTCPAMGRHLASARMTPAQLLDFDAGFFDHFHPAVVVLADAIAE